ncbi:MHYT domain-containing protein [Streptomyces shenzhenensis]|uniref:MHYT domain-containing protein n=1 Tax=Streptomyces shenzhenensis TaxID=943815 RepID=UPI001F42E9C4|nr:MHYT domain-containing protein [Streptomyces shenzhenensis]
MTADVSEFHYGLVTPVAAYLMACLGAVLALRCTTRSIGRGRGEKRFGWLALGAVSLGCGIWTMHFIAMIGFSVDGALVSYDAGRTALSLAVCIAVVAVGVFLVGYRGSGPVTLGTAGVFTGLGVAAMHYLGMTAMNTGGTVHYGTTAVVLSVVIAVVAATAALWAAVSISAVWATVGASLVMGAAVSAMHYTGMAAVSVHVVQAQAGGQSSTNLLAFLLVMLAGPVAALILAAAIVMFDPEVVGGGRRDRTTTGTSAPALPTPQQQSWSPTDHPQSLADRRYTS